MEQYIFIYLRIKIVLVRKTVYLCDIFKSVSANLNSIEQIILQLESENIVVQFPFQTTYLFNISSKYGCEPILQSP